MPKSILGKTQAPTANKPLKALFYGPPGSGKTVLGATAPTPLVLDFEDGSMSIREAKVDLYPIRKWEDVTDAWYTLATEGHSWKSVVIDTVSMMQEVASRETKLLSDFTAGTDPRHSYGKISAIMKDIIWKFALLPMNVIFLAQMRIEDVEPGDKPEEGTYPLLPDVTPSIYKVLAAAPDVIGRTFVRNTPGGVIYGVSFGPDSRSVAKQRALGLPAEVSNLTIPKLIEKIGGKK